jgi:hypothetical protein
MGAAVVNLTPLVKLRFFPPKAKIQMSFEFTAKEGLHITTSESGTCHLYKL